MIKSDYKAYNMNLFSLLKGLFTLHSFYAVLLYRVGNWLYRHHIKFLPDITTAFQRFFFSCEIAPYAQIGYGFRLHHTTGIVIGCDCVLGNNCEVFQNVSLGENRRKRIEGRHRMPQVGNNVTIYAGACLIGPIIIGNNVEIGANSVVTKDYPDDVIIAGIPASVIAHKK